jgi:hypothetical protein
MLGAGCASSPEPSDAQIVKAETSIEHAASSDAPEYAAASLDNARKKLTAAKIAAENGEEKESLRLAKEAEIDAEVAVALAEQAEAEESLREVREGIDTLREELGAEPVQGGTQ